MPSQSRSRALKQQQQQAVCSKPDLAWTVQSPETLCDVLHLLAAAAAAAAAAAGANFFS